MKRLVFVFLLAMGFCSSPLYASTCDLRASNVGAISAPVNGINPYDYLLANNMGVTGVSTAGSGGGYGQNYIFSVWDGNYPITSANAGVITFGCNSGLPDPTTPDSYVCPDGSENAGQYVDSLSANVCNPVCKATAGLVHHITSEAENGDIFFAYGCKGYTFNCNGTTCDTCLSGLGSYSEGGTSGFSDWHYSSPPSSCADLTGSGDGGYSENQTHDAPSTSQPTKFCDDPTLTAGSPCLVRQQLPNPSVTPYNPVFTPPATASAPASLYPIGGDPTNPTGSTGTGIGGVPTIDPGSSPGGGSGTVENPGDSISYGAFPSLPAGGFYTRRYNSLSDLYANNMAIMQETPLFSFIDSFSLPEGVGSIPNWTIDMTNMGGVNLGVHVITLPDWMWSVLFWFTQITAIFYCRRIIFGV